MVEKIKNGVKVIRDNKFKIALINRCLIVVLGFLGLIQYYLRDGNDMFWFYTQQSNMLIFILFTYLVYKMVRSLIFKEDKEYTFENTKLLKIKGMFTMCITLTFLVYAILLAPQVEISRILTLRNLSLHYIVPILVILDFIILDKNKVLTKLDVLSWTILPIIYFIMSLYKGVVFKSYLPNTPSSPFPYFFLNVNKYGWSGVLMWILVLVVFYEAISFGYYYIKSRGKEE